MPPTIWFARTERHKLRLNGHPLRQQARVPERLGRDVDPRGPDPTRGELEVPADNPPPAVVDEPSVKLDSGAVVLPSEVVEIDAEPGVAGTLSGSTFSEALAAIATLACCASAVSIWLIRSLAVSSAARLWLC